MDFENETTDMQHSIDNMGDTLIEAIKVALKESRLKDADAIMQEWITSENPDPCNGEYEFMFTSNNTYGDWTWDACASS